MKKALQNKINKFYCKLYTLQMEFEQLHAEVQAEADAAEEKFNEVEVKYNDAEIPSDALEERYNKAEELNEEMQNVLCALDDVTIEDAINSLEEYTCDLPEDLTVKLKEKPKTPNKLIITVDKKEFIEKTNQFFLTLLMHTDAAPYPVKHRVYWDADANAWEHDFTNSASLPWLGGGDLYKEYIIQKDALYTQMFNSTDKITATFTRSGD